MTGPRTTSAAEPNLFHHAPSELSQDAFLCWLLEWLNHPDHPLYEPARQLLNRILSKATVTVDLANLNRVYLRRQFRGVDILAVLEVSPGLSVCLAIEDKVDAKLTGSDQLLRNRRSVIDHANEWEPLHNVPPDRVIGVLIKSGFDFDFVPPLGHVMLTWQDLERWVAELPSRPLAASEILRDWYRWYEGRLNLIRAADLPSDVEREGFAMHRDGGAFDNRLHNGRWSDSVFQYRLLKRLLSPSGAAIVEVVEDKNFTHAFFPAPSPTAKRPYLLLGTSNGRAWTQYHFDTIRDEWFYRLDWQSGIWGISLRLYQPTKAPEVLDNMRAVGLRFSDVLAARGIATRRFRKTDSATESTCLLIDPGQSLGLFRLAEAHGMLVDLLARGVAGLPRAPR